VNDTETDFAFEGNQGVREKALARELLAASEQGTISHSSVTSYFFQRGLAAGS